ncbi:MAG: apolipoprotein N-acyltransferase [Oscillatoriaceae bacterium SKW80]|nr:apolipoprotein N-acyltransferase [Oscillatoriaceae bacterium SKYG93]MCX8119928.1 apolipoprotein N-acyltransferase [Oscillatoriaceae bacterium SKW80]MDW8454086.1 apolipoprotein N-acyltransferase [Oscillatoriaceae cyanobacterium SKYGB_i_bin93]
MGLTPAPVSAWPLAWIALAPLWGAVIIIAESKKNWLINSLPALLWGIGFHGVALFWITGIHPMTWMGVPWLSSLAIAFFCWIFITLWGAALVTIWAFALSFIFTFQLKNQNLKKTETSLHLVLSRVIIGAALWVSLETLWSSGPLWWTSLSYTQSPNNLLILQLGKISGPSTITASIVAVNGLIAEAWINRKKCTPKNTAFNFWAPWQLKLNVNYTYLSVAASLFVGLHLIGLGLYNRPLNDTPKDALKVGIIQGNIPNTIKLYEDGKRRALDNYTAGYKNLAAQGVEAVLTPETALPMYLSEIKQENFYATILEKGVPVWIGAFGIRGLSYTNSLFTLMGTGEVFSQYDKIKLVPLGEYIPFEEFIGGLINRLSPLNAHLAAGDASQIFDTPFARAIVGICYESAFAEHFRRQAAAGGQFILTASNNAHYSPAMPAQHHAQDVMRAIETNRWAVRATNTGYSGIVDPQGKTVWISGINTYEIHADIIYRRQTQTLYVRWGDWLTPVLWGLGALAWFIGNRISLDF